MCKLIYKNWAYFFFPLGKTVIWTTIVSQTDFEIDKSKAIETSHFDREKTQMLLDGRVPLIGPRCFFVSNSISLTGGEWKPFCIFSVEVIFHLEILRFLLNTLTLQFEKKKKRKVTLQKGIKRLLVQNSSQHHGYTPNLVKQCCLALPVKMWTNVYSPKTTRLC